MQRDRLFNLLSLVMLGMTLLVIGYYILIAMNPYTPLNPFPPAQRTLAVVATLTPTVTPPRKEAATWTPTATPTPRVTRSPYPFTYELVYETPYYGCSWLGTGGNVQDLDGNALTDYRVHVWGGGIDVVIISGSKQIYGDSGWEQFFLNQPVEMNGVFRVQLHSKYEPYTPVSEEIVLNFPGLCSKSLAHIIFTQNH